MKKKSLSLSQKELESKLLREVTAWLESMRFEGVKMIRINDISHKGYSDIFVCVRGQFVVLELKKESGVRMIHQKEFIKEMLEANAIGGFCESLEEVQNYIMEALEYANKSQ